MAFGGLGAKALLDGAKGPQAPSIGVQVSVGSSHSSMQSSEDQTIQRGSSINAGGNAKLIATGNGTPKDGNITIAGSNVNAANVALVANNQVNLVNTTATDKTQSSNSSSGSSVGVSIGTNGLGVTASLQRAHGDGNSDAAIQNNTHINASQTATIVSGGDTNVIGANVNANKVVADVGGVHRVSLLRQHLLYIRRLRNGPVQIRRVAVQVRDVLRLLARLRDIDRAGAHRALRRREPEPRHEESARVRFEDG